MKITIDIPVATVDELARVIARAVARELKSKYPSVAPVVKKPPPETSPAARQPDLYSIEEACAQLGGMSRVSIYKLIHSGKLESVHVGRRRFISARAIEAFIAASSTTAAPGLKEQRQDAVREMDAPRGAQFPKSAQDAARMIRRGRG